MQQKTLIINNLVAGYKNQPIINNLSLQPLHTGQLVALVGSNGAGKSTLLRAIAGLITATGSVSLDGVNLLQCNNTQRAKHFGLMPQSIPAGNSLTVFETVMSALMSNKDNLLSNQQAYEQSAQILTQLQIHKLANRALKDLSGGQRQMASLAQALVRNPSILLLDEPTSALDLRFQFFVMQTVKNLTNKGYLILIVLHDLTLAARWADKIIVLKQGQLYCEGTPQQSITATTLADIYGVKADIKYDKNSLQINVCGLV